MITTLDVRSDRRIWANLSLQHVALRGRLVPRLILTFSGTPTSRSKVTLHDVTLRLEYGGELIGVGRIQEASLNYDQAQIVFEVATEPRLLRWVNDGLTRDLTVVEFGAVMSGTASGIVEPGGPDLPRFVGDPEPGERTPFTLVNHGITGSLQIARAEWFSQVWGPSRCERYRFLEISLPLSDENFGREWRRAVERLESAERAYALGQDATVFLELRGAMDSLPGAKKAVLVGVGDPGKRKALDDLLKQVGNYLHLGRHVAASGVQQGTFPVSHHDAAFAVDMVRVLLSHLSFLLTVDLL